MAVENLNEIETSLGLEPGKLSEMITSEESHTIDLSERIILPKETYEERISNLKKEAATAAIEIAVKEQRNALGLEFQGKTIENLVNAIKVKVETDSKIEPEEKYKNLKSDFEKLQSNLVEKENEFTTFKTNIERQNSLAEIKNEFTKYVPDNTLVSKSTIFVEAKEKGFSFEKEDGRVVIKDAMGNVIKNDSTLSPVSVKEWVTEFVTPYLPTATGGSGKKDEPGGAKTGSLEAFMKEAEKQGWNASQQNEEMAKRIANGTLKL
ncbi:hypothetical protein [Flavobacterium sp.]|uniref:hypothetical protein n=1 Tax=Flavobacterium sp. TaxID=239 RepID=UPI0025ECEAE5|nr:hypothetical protein [Flavobacterium sp.]